jgi:hypothetical protein
MAITNIERTDNQWIYTLDSSGPFDVYLNYGLYLRETTSPITIESYTDYEPHVEIIDSTLSRITDNLLMQSVSLNYKCTINWRGNVECDEYKIYEIKNNLDYFKKSIPETQNGYYTWQSENIKTSGTYTYRIDFIKDNNVISSDDISSLIIVPTDKNKYIIDYDAYTFDLTFDYDYKHLQQGIQ